MDYALKLGNQKWHIDFCTRLSLIFNVCCSIFPLKKECEFWNVSHIFIFLFFSISFEKLNWKKKEKKRNRNVDEGKGVGQVVGAISWMSRSLMIDECVVAGSSHVWHGIRHRHYTLPKTEMPRIKQHLSFFHVDWNLGMVIEWGGSVEI